MKILWAKTDFLHPTDRGGQIRTLGMLRPLSRRHEIHYVAYEGAEQAEAMGRASEYSSRAYPVPPPGVPRLLRVAAGMFSPLPFAVSNYASPPMRARIDALLGEHRFDAVVCDFVAMAPNFSRIEDCVLFQHNVETLLWRRRTERAANPFLKLISAYEARRMSGYEKEVCRRARKVIGVSAEDARVMEEMFGIRGVAHVPTGVDVEFFAPPEEAPKRFDLVFLGSMDWVPNIDGVVRFHDEILPLIRRRRPDCTLAIAGRRPVPEIEALAANDPRITVTGTVPDVRPYLWESKVSIVPLWSGSGTRLKIYEAMAAAAPVVSTAIGAEGLEIDPPRNIRIADDAQAFAENCLALIESEELRTTIGRAGRTLVEENFSWDHAARRFEEEIFS